MIKIKPTKKNLKGILNDPEFFRSSYRFKKHKKNIVLPTRLKSMLELVEGGMDEEIAITKVYPNRKTNPKTILKNMKNKYPYFIKALAMAKEVYQENILDTRRNRMDTQDTTIHSNHSSFNADESLRNWKDMFEIAKQQKNLNAMISIQANIDKIVNAQGQYDETNRKDKQVFTRDISEIGDDSWKDELGPILRMFESKGIKMPTKEDIPSTKRKYTKSGKERLPKISQKTKRTEIIEELNPLPNMIFPV